MRSLLTSCVQAIHMALFILRTFKVQDEEIQGLHLPVVFSALMNILNVSRNIFWLLDDDANFHA